MQDKIVNRFVPWIAFSGFLAVAVGAFGAHVLRVRIDTGLLAVLDTGNKYHFYHTLAAGIATLLFLSFGDKTPEKQKKAVVLLFLWGNFFFAGSLYLLAITGIRWLGAITPIGGIMYMLGWAILGYTFVFQRR